ncbi:hypothetical protein C7S20_18845 [Christiangramia fulva]|uniref:Uncharacterized protein n=1 Tax=Christiangramia fulva TaxID=2126553 RepID=A0A2R3ZA49_9FLAO|nr:hypothetical protein [Christiangramia fulva]AVR47141.1 hypothetical protein C7S20_18845 [Christiangramia fulva]
MNPQRRKDIGAENWKTTGRTFLFQMKFETAGPGRYMKLLGLLEAEFDLYQQQRFSDSLVIRFPGVKCEIKRKTQRTSDFAEVTFTGRTKMNCKERASQFSEVYKFFLQIL